MSLSGGVVSLREDYKVRTSPGGWSLGGVGVDVQEYTSTGVRGPEIVNVAGSTGFLMKMWLISG